MIIHDVEQGSVEWHALRAGIPTASEFSNLITPKKWEPSASQERYLNELLHAKKVGRLEDEAFESEAMLWGREHEQDAADSYEFLHGVTVEKVGFITNDEKTFGCSPDRLVGEDGLLEIKCPKGATHVAYLRHRKIEDEKLPQLMGQLLITGRKWVDIVSYHPMWEPVIIRVERDETKITALGDILTGFCSRLEGEWQKVKGDTNNHEEK